MTTQGLLTQEAAEELFATPNEELDQLLQARMMAIQMDPSLILQPSFHTKPADDLESFGVPNWIKKTVDAMIKTATHQTHDVVCSDDPDFKDLRDRLVAALGLGGTAAVLALSGLLITTFGLAAALASVVATIIIKTILGPTFDKGHDVMCKELEKSLPK